MFIIAPRIEAISTGSIHIFSRDRIKQEPFHSGVLGVGADEIFIILHYKDCSSCLICEFTDLCDKPIKLMELVQQYIMVPGFSLSGSKIWSIFRKIRTVWGEVIKSKMLQVS